MRVRKGKRDKSSPSIVGHQNEKSRQENEYIIYRQKGIITNISAKINESGEGLRTTVLL